MTEPEQIDIEKRLAVLEAELELARRVADAAVAHSIASSAESKLTRMTPPDWRDEDARVISIHACHTLMGAEENARVALDSAVREYRARVEAAAFMAQPAVRRGLDGVGEMEEEQ